MGLFGNENSIEPVQGTATRKARAEEPPIREATGAEIAAATQRRERAAAAEAKAPPVVEVRGSSQRASSNDAETDAIAKQHNLYTADRRSTRIYYNDYQQKSEVMRASPAKITTKLGDRQTVTAMLDLAQARGWDTVKLRGSDEFKREAWVQAQQRGIVTEGYKPQPTDLQEAARRRTAAAPVQGKAGVRAAEAPKAADANKVETTRQAPVVAKEAAQEVAPATEKAATKTAAVSTKVKAESTVPKAAPDEVRKQRAAEKKAVWGSVEAVGKEARKRDTVKQGETSTVAARPASAAEAA